MSPANIAPSLDEVRSSSPTACRPLLTSSAMSATVAEENLHSEAEPGLQAACEHQAVAAMPEDAPPSRITSGTPTEKEFACMLKSRPIEIEVGRGSQKETFFIHESLLYTESDKYKAQLQGPGEWKEKLERKISIEEEDPELFRSFIDYLYLDKSPTGKKIDEPEIVQLARLYCMGDRIMAKRFQDAVLYNCFRILNQKNSKPIPVADLCSLLEIVFTELPEKDTRQDPLQHCVTRLGASRPVDLQKDPRFKDELSRDLPEIARGICLCLIPSGDDLDGPPFSIHPRTKKAVKAQKALYWRGFNKRSPRHWR
ncbi:hypothetical protein IWZ00DRAFT_528637 [Phyllosticta capitalensis]